MDRLASLLLLVGVCGGAADLAPDTADTDDAEPALTGCLADSFDVASWGAPTGRR